MLDRMWDFGTLGSSFANEELASNNIGSGLDWEDTLNLDWLSGHEVQYVVPPTQESPYQTKVFQQSVTIIIKLQNATELVAGASAVEESGVSVGPWRVPEEQLPVLVGTLVGASLLILLMVTLLIYTACSQRNNHKKYSVKSDASSVTSGRTADSGPSLDRDSLVMVTHQSALHQGCLLSKGRGSITGMVYGCECCCDSSCGTSQFPCHCQVNDGQHQYNMNFDKHRASIYEPNPFNTSFEASFNTSFDSEEDPLPRSTSMPIKEEEDSIAVDDTMSSMGLSQTSMSGSRPPSKEMDTYSDMFPVLMSASFTPCQTPSDATINHFVDSRNVLDTAEPLSNWNDINDNSEAFKTRSLPAWVRNKSKPLAAYHNTISHKDKQPTWSKKRRNRMRSDAAAVIALSKSRRKLISPTSQVVCMDSNQSVSSTTSATDTDALVKNEVAIVYDERTAL